MIDRRRIVNRLHEGCSPLFISCKRGNVEIVEYLIEQCQADIELKGIFKVYDDRSIHLVSPLWSAAVAGKLDVVKCLIKHGANVNSVSDTGSTPIRSACFMTNLEIVKFLTENGADILKPNHNGGTCLINSIQSVPLCEYLLKNGADVNAQDMQMKTALHYAIQEHRIETAILLLDYGADPYIKNRYGDDALQTACLKGAKQIFAYLIQRLPYSRERIADAYELLGSTFLDEHFDLFLTQDYWRKALEIRFEDEKNIIHKQILPPNSAFMNAREFINFDELEEVSNDLDAMRMQSLLITERILSSTHKEMIYRLMYRGATYADGLQFQRCIDLWKYALVLRVRKDTLFHNEAAFAAHALVRLFLDLNDKAHNNLVKEGLQYQDIYDTIELIVNQLGACQELLKIRPVFKRHQENFDQTLKILTHLIYILNMNSSTAEQENSNLKLLNRIRRLDPKNSNGDSLLHLVISKTNIIKSHVNNLVDNYSSVFPDLKTCRLLLKVGYDVDTVNYSLETPLHIATLHQNFNEKIVKLLLLKGAHIDQKDLTGNQPSKRLAAINKSITINPLRFMTLKCLASNKIRSYNLKYIDLVPKEVEKFINLH
ncbi:ankyrin repeat domain containing protein 8 [Sarcoptes scabiei]|nr:ankyrin repeat domain containing protein 8 [Sarcoptes scabiei]